MNLSKVGRCFSVSLITWLISVFATKQTYRADARQGSLFLNRIMRERGTMSAVTRWIKPGKVHEFVFLGKEVIATSSGNHVLFYNLVKKEERIEYFNSPSRGEGACCLAGHSIIPIFATAERKYNPKIFVHTYPEIRKIAECRLVENLNFYISCCFLGTEFLLSLTSFPNFQLVVWLWRTGEKVANIDTILRNEIQTIESSLNSPNLVYQFSSTTGELITYEMYACSRKVYAIKNVIRATNYKISSVSWTSNNNLLLCDIFRNSYIVSSDGKKVQLLLPGDSNFDAHYPTIIFPFCNGFVLTDDESSLTYYNKSILDNKLSENWNIAWSVKCASRPLKLTQARHKEAILLQCEDGKVFKIRLTQENKPVMEEIFNYYRRFKLIVSIKPAETHAVLLDVTNCLSLVNIFDGTISPSFKINDEVLCTTTHPLVPLVTAGTSSGNIFCFIVSHGGFSLIRKMCLHRTPFDKVKFSKNGIFLAAASSTSNDIFLLKTVINKEIKVISHLKCTKSITDFLIYERESSVQMLILLNSFSIKNVGNCVEVYSVKEAENSTAKMYEVCLQNCYQRLEYGVVGICDFVGTPYLSKQLHLFKFENNCDSIVLFNVISASHHLRKFDVHISENYLTTSGSDGSVILRKHCDLSKIVSTFTSHHYQEYGIKYSVISSDGTAVVTLGNNGSLIGLNLSNCTAIMHNEKQNDKRVIWEGADSNVVPCSNEQTWLEQEELLILQRETKKVLALKDNISIDLTKLKLKVSELLDANELKSSESKLPVSTFDLNVNKRKCKLRAALKAKEENKVVLQQRLDEKEEIIRYLMQNFWDSWEVHDCTLVSFDNKNRVKNFSLRRIDKPEKMNDYSIELFDIPLSIMPTEMNLDFEVMRIDNQISRTFLRDLIYLESDNEIVFTGSRSFRWIENDLPPNQLMKMTTEPIQYDVIDCRENKLKIYFNRKFDEMKRLKGKLLQEIEDCQIKLSKYKSELKDVYGIISKDSDFAIFKWQSIEIPENVISVKEEEVIPELLPDVHSSYEMEQMRDSVKLTRIDEVYVYDPSFRDVQLNQMMDGLLEIRWEDEIRKSIPKPDCVLYKSPSKYNIEDLKAISAYREKVVILEIERRKYKSYLEAEISNINEKIKAAIEDFDKRMEEFSLEKIKIQSAILQEILLRLNDEKGQLSKDEGRKKIFHMMHDELSQLESENKNLISEISEIEPAVAELRNRYEGLNKRDKILECKFRGEFVELKQPIVEHLLRQYKRRPRIAQIACTSSACLVETSRCLTTGRKSAILPREYLDFLRGMDTLDVMPSSLPPQIDFNHWQTLCRLRRNKVEMEIKLRIAAIELAEAEQTLFYIEKLSSSIQSKIYLTRNNIEEESLRQSRSLNNRDIQLILKAAQIEISITGQSSNCENATVVNYRQLIEVNKEILCEGEEKIKAMRALTKLGKSMNFQHWKCQCLSTNLKHFKEHLVVLQKTKIGKEMQNYLVERSEDRIHYRGATSCGKMLKSVQKKFQRMLNEERTGLLRVIAEIRYWRRRNAELIERIEVSEAHKLECGEVLEGDQLRRRNRLFRRNYMRSITERTSLVEKVKESRDELTSLQTQLEILRLKTYPTLRFKDVSYHRRSVYSRKN